MAHIDQIINSDAVDNAFIITGMYFESGSIRFPVLTVSVNASIFDTKVGGSGCSITVLPIQVAKKENIKGGVKELDTEKASKTFEQVKIDTEGSVILTNTGKSGVKSSVVLYRGRIVDTQINFNTSQTSFSKRFSITIGHPAATIAAHHVESPFLWGISGDRARTLDSYRKYLTINKTDSTKYESQQGFDLVKYIVDTLEGSAKKVGDTGGVTVSSLLDISTAPMINSKLKAQDTTGKGGGRVVTDLRTTIYDQLVTSSLSNSEWTSLVNMLDQFELLVVPNMRFGKNDKYSDVIVNMAMGADVTLTLKPNQILSYTKYAANRAKNRRRAIAVHTGIVGKGTGVDSPAFSTVIQGYVDGKPTLFTGTVEMVSSNDPANQVLTIVDSKGTSRKIPGMPFTKIDLPSWVKTACAPLSDKEAVNFKKRVADMFAKSFYCSGLVKMGSLSMSIPLPLMLDSVRTELGKVLKAELDGGVTLYGQLSSIDYTIEADKDNFKVSASLQLSTVRNSDEQRAWSISSEDSDLLFTPRNK